MYKPARPHEIRCSFETVLWDVDGTLLDTTALLVDSLRHMYARFFNRHPSDEELKALIGLPLRRQVGEYGDPEAFGTTAAEVEAEFLRYYTAGRQRERPIVSVIAILRETRSAGANLGLVTSKNHVEAAMTLPCLKLGDAVDVTITADDIQHPKPAPDGILLAMSRLSCSATGTAYVGDTVYDMQAAHAAGVHAIGVTWGAGRAPELKAAGATSICTTPAELQTLLLTVDPAR
ncbi:MAG: HAD family hydrolase [Armatimonadetes bacterium]|nr:HAD family hydrolase [Armatimonadota bacterium]MDE2206377.1 HAD family hydrolase [Armatimonadota bacterium]